MMVAQHFKCLAQDRLKGHCEAINDSINDANEGLKRGLKSKGLGWRSTNPLVLLEPAMGFEPATY